MQLRIYILLLFLIADTISMAQVLFIDDTLKIGEVMVKSSLPEGAAGYKQLKIESELLQNIAGESIAYLLRNNSSLYIKNYGAGGLATSSFRGMGANHTEILWEGQRINSPMLGTTDFATIPTFFIDRVDVFYGGNPGLFGNRGPGGAISFASEVDWKERFKVAYMQDIGSFSTYCEGLKLSLGSVNFQYRLKAYNRSAANDFKYFDYTSGEEIELYRSNSEEKSQGVLQEIYLKSKESIVSAKLWYSGTDRHLPGSIYVSQTEGNETQYDESLRGIVKYQLYKDNFSLEANTVYFSDWLQYSNQLLSVDSRNKSDRFSAQLSGLYSFAANTKIRAGISGSATKVKSNNYDGDKLRNDMSIDLSLSHIIAEKFGVLASINQRLLDAKLLPVQSSLGLDYLISSSKNYHLKGSIGKSIQLPSLNDLYWMPGGNPDLKPENSFNGELSFSISAYAGRNSLIESELTLFRSSIKDMIVWLPLSASVWQPQNINNVVSLGIEIFSKYSYSSGINHLYITLNYSFTDARKTNSTSLNDESVDKQLIYVPRNSGSIKVKYIYRKLSSEWWTVYTGARFIASDNSEKLDSYLLHNFSLRILLGNRKLEFNPGLSVDNIFANRYINVVGYPMPMRSFRLSASIKFGN